MDEIIFKGKSKKGKEIVIRYPEKADLQELLNFINELSQEKTFILYQGEVINEEYEIKYLDSILKQIEEKTRVHLLVFCNNKLIGGAELSKDRLARKHVGIFHMAVLKDFRSEGIGKILMSQVLEEGLKVISGLKIISISVFADNPIARKLYESFGFVECGKLPKGVKHGNEFIDEILLYKGV